MNLPYYTLHRGFWRATTAVTIISVFAVVFRGAGPGNGGGTAANLWLSVGLAIIPGCCLGILQAFLLENASLLARIRWFGITVVSISIGWCIVFAIMAWLTKLQFFTPIILQGPFQAALIGFITGALPGAIVGYVSGLIQAYLQHLPARQWISSNVIIWGFSLGIPYAMILVIASMFTLPIF